MCHRLQIAACKPSVSQETFIDNTPLAGFLVQFLITRGEDAADVYEPVLLCAHGESICIGKHLPGDFSYGLIPIAFFPLSDEVCVFGKPGRIQEHRDRMLFCDSPYFPYVLHSDRLAAVAVTRNGYVYAGNPFLAVGFDLLDEASYVYVALEGMPHGCLEAFFDYEVNRLSAFKTDVPFRSIEVHVPKDSLTGFDQHGSEDVFSCTSLVCREDMLESGDFSDSVP